MAQQFCKRLALSAALVSLGLGVNAYAQGTATGTSSSTGNAAASKSSASGSSSSALSSDDRKFVEKAAKGGMEEVELGQIAQQKAQNAEVKTFASRMVTDHGKANDELKSLASNKGVTLPAPDADKSGKKHADELNKKAADKFDHEYMEMMVKDHKKDVKEFEHAAKNAKDADLRAWAAKTLPTLQDHLKMAEAAEASVKKGGKK
jgi:putative membrane protein